MSTGYDEALKECTSELETEKADTNSSDIKSEPRMDRNISNQVDESNDEKLKCRMCDECAEVDEENKAIMKCINEDVYLCDKCAKQHKVQKDTKLHDVISLDNKFDAFCELCESDNQKVEGYGFCENCEEPQVLCFRCSSRHVKMKKYKTHKISTDSDAFARTKRHLNQNVSRDASQDRINQNLISFKCDICAEIEEQSDADSICKNEKIYLCNGCAKRHKVQSATKGHKVEKVNENSFCNICELCKSQDEFVEGHGYCEDCEEPEILCLACSKRHSAQKQFKQHTISTNIDKLMKNRSFQFYGSESAMEEADTQISKDFPCTAKVLPFQQDHATQESKANVTENLTLKEDKTEKGKQIECSLCKDNGENNLASSYCVNCKIPEPLCNICGEQHIKQKSTRDHKLSFNLDFFFSHTDREMCEQCLYDGEKRMATMFCQSCEEPEALCGTCAKAHVRQRNNRDHKLCSDISQMRVAADKIRLLCELCKYDEEETDATCFCLDCDDKEPFCDACGSEHLKQKMFRQHKLSRDLTQYKKTEENILLCEICILDNEKNKATSFCLTCENPEPLCSSCSKQHLRQKQCRTHEISNDMAKWPSKCNAGQTVMCEPCAFSEVSRIATSFCTTCDEPEPMCDECASQHIRPKSQRQHQISKDLEQLKGLEKTESQKPGVKEMTTTTDGKEIGSRKINMKPQLQASKSDEVTLFWERQENVDFYQIRYKRMDSNDKWKIVMTENACNSFTIKGLMADTTYVFQVRSVTNDTEGQYSAESDPITTPQSLATNMLKFSIQIKEGTPSKYQLLSEENRGARNQQAKTKQMFLGKVGLGLTKEKTVMLVGATGSGKSTLVDGFVNYIMGVSFDDPFRFTLVQLESDEQKTHNQAESQTEWITVYKIAPQDGSRLDYTLNIIDTPGFGDTRGIERDKAIVDQIRYLFSATGEQGVTFLDAVCFIVKAPDARLTATQTYIFHSIMSLFGKDIESNICTLITFADGGEPPVLSCLKAAQLPYGSWFAFNNSALFAPNKNQPQTSLSPMFWDMGCKNYFNFFEKLKTLSTRSLSQTKDVLQKREELQTVIANIHPQISAGLSKLNELKNQLDLFDKHKSDIENNKNFTYEHDVIKQKQIELPIGQHVTNCLQCNVSCHDNCAFADDDDKSRCSAMGQDGNCKVCTGKCHWRQHKNAKYILKYVTEKVTETYQDKKKRYEEAKGAKMTNEKFLEGLSNDIDLLFENVNCMMTQMNECKNRLKEIALRPDPLSTVEHIDQMIQAEEINKQVGFESRIKMLNEFKKHAQIDKSVANFEQTVVEAKKNVSKATGKTTEKKSTFSLPSFMKNLFN